VVPPGDPRALADALRTLISNPRVADQLGKNGRKHAEEQFQWSKLVSSWLRDLAQSSLVQ
jgi:glycosyltransferase involved in cell wall biosynthesis